MNDALPQERPAYHPRLELIPPWRQRWFPTNELALIIVVLAECAVFTVAGNRFSTTTNAFEIVRLAVEIGLLALALTPVIVTGGIDLSVGSMIGLSSVVMGLLWREANFPLPMRSQRR